MTAEPLLLAIDNGTQSVRAFLFDLDGELVAYEKVPVEPYFSEKPGWAEQHPQTYWDAVCAACRGLLAGSRVEVARIVGMAVTAQRSTVVNLDERGEPLRPAIVWLDQRRCSDPPRVSPLVRAVVRLSGRSELVRELGAEAECNWIAQNQPRIAVATDRFLFLSGYLAWRLTGEFVDSTASQVGYVPFDYRRARWASPKDLRWRLMAVERRQLPDLVEVGRRLGEVSARAAAETGLPPGLPVIATGSDKACELLGSGCMDPSVAGLSFGTTATINTVNDRYVEATPPLPAYVSAVPGRWKSELLVRRGFWMVEWFKREFGGDLIGDESSHPDAYRRLEQMLVDTPAGAEGLLLQPYWSSGVPFPGSEARGAVIGFGDMHGRAHLYRAIVEGIGHALLAAAGLLAKRNRVPIGELRVAGGGARSDAVMQITADMFGMPAQRPHVVEASGLGAAINVAVGLGLHDDYETAVARMTRIGDVFEPNDENHRLYRTIHERVYKDMYRRLRPLYGEIRDITGYPP